MNKKKCGRRHWINFLWTRCYQAILPWIQEHWGFVKMAQDTIQTAPDLQFELNAKHTAMQTMDKIEEHMAALIPDAVERGKTFGTSLNEIKRMRKYYETYSTKALEGTPQWFQNQHEANKDERNVGEKMITFQYIPNIDILGNESNGWFIMNVFADDGKIEPDRLPS